MISLRPMVLALAAAFAAVVVAKDSAIQVDSEGNVIEVDIDSSLNNVLGKGSDGDPFASISIHIHRNGEPAPCEDISGPKDDEESPILSALRKELHDFEVKDEELFRNKYGFDSLMTRALANWLIDEDKCYEFGVDEDNEVDYSAFIDYCDMGEDRTVVQKDHHLLIPVPLSEDGNEVFALPCQYYTREGLRISSLAQLGEIARSASENDDEKKELHLYAVPAGRLFSFAPSYIGEIFELDHVTEDDDFPMSLEVISLVPRVFEIKNFFDEDEADELIEAALEEKNEEFRLQRIKTGEDEDEDSRTSESALVSDEIETVMDLKSRAFELLGIDEYDQCKGDGLQVIRYNKTSADLPASDFLGYHNFDSDDSFISEYASERTGTNRFATIALYLSDVAEDAGGASVFPKSDYFSKSKLPETSETPDQALEFLRKNGATKGLKEGSWEEEMVLECNTRLSVKPKKGRAILYYAQRPDGVLEVESEHGGCPVLDGDKWAANIWVWNGPREGCPDGPQQQMLEMYGPPLQALFVNKGVDPGMANAELFFQDHYWGPIGHDDAPQMIDTYAGHEWSVRVDGEVIKKWTIQEDEKVQTFYI